MTLDEAKAIVAGLKETTQLCGGHYFKTAEALDLCKEAGWSAERTREGLSWALFGAYSERELLAFTTAWGF